MVSILRRAIGFAVLFFIFEHLYSFILRNLGIRFNQDSSWLSLALIAYVLPLVLGALFTYIYVLKVNAHLSNGFRMRAALYTVLLSFLYILGLNAFSSLEMIPYLLTYGVFWAQALISLVMKYISITVGNWLASHKIKTQGHI